MRNRWGLIGAFVAGVAGVVIVLLAGVVIVLLGGYRLGAPAPTGDGSSS